MTRTQQVIDEITEIARQNISDPVTARANKGDSWIYSHFPKYGSDADLPRIGFHKISSSHPQVTLGSTAARTEADIQASIMVRRGKKYDFDGDGETEEEENLSDYLHDKVIEVVKNNQSQIKDLGEDVSYVVPVTSDTVKPEGQNFILEALTFEVRIDNC